MKARIVLVPVDGTARGLEAVRQVAREGREAILRVELVSVKPKFNRHIARFTAKSARDAWRAEQSARALEPAKRVLDEAGIPVALHAASGPVAEVIAEMARHLRVDEIVLASRRQGPLARLLGNSLSSQLCAFAPVPVRVIPTAAPATLDRIAIPAGLGLGIAAALAITSD